MKKHGLSDTRTHRAWIGMRKRCSNRCHKDLWDRYYGRGIRVCKRWDDSFQNFIDDMGEAPAGLSIDRYPDNDGNYEPGNCRWATQSQQNHNKSKLLIELGGLRLGISEWSIRTGLRGETIRYRFCKLKWSSEKTLSTPGRSIKLWRFSGGHRPLSEWSKILGIREGKIRLRLLRGWSIEEALSNE